VDAGYLNPPPSQHPDNVLAPPPRMPTHMRPGALAVLCRRQAAASKTRRWDRAKGASDEARTKGRGGDRHQPQHRRRHRGAGGRGRQAGLRRCRARQRSAVRGPPEVSRKFLAREMVAQRRGGSVQTAPTVRQTLMLANAGHSAAYGRPSVPRPVRPSPTSTLLSQKISVISCVCVSKRISRNWLRKFKPMIASIPSRAIVALSRMSSGGRVTPPTLMSCSR
jgi:hypothetical protein